jgi:hypothetical protein
MNLETYHAFAYTLLVLSVIRIGWFGYRIYQFSEIPTPIRNALAVRGVDPFPKLHLIWVLFFLGSIIYLVTN